MSEELRKALDILTNLPHTRAAPAPGHEDSDDLTIAYMAGGYDARKQLAEAQGEIERLRILEETCGRAIARLVVANTLLATMAQALRNVVEHSNPSTHCPLCAEHAQDALAAYDEHTKGSK